jgi:hypothetical protein
MFFNHLKEDTKTMTLKECRQATTKYLIENNGTSEFDMVINDISRETIKAMKRENETCHLGKINLNDDDSSKLVKYTGQKVFNFEYDFCLPCYDEQIEQMIDERSKAPYNSKEDLKRIEKVTERIQQLNGCFLFWS